MSTITVVKDKIPCYESELKVRVEDADKEKASRVVAAAIHAQEKDTPVLKPHEIVLSPKSKNYVYKVAIFDIASQKMVPAWAYLDPPIHDKENGTKHRYSLKAMIDGAEKCAGSLTLWNENVGKVHRTYVDWIGNDKEKHFKHVGMALLSMAIEDSIKFGYDGELFLNAAYDNCPPFYWLCGFDSISEKIKKGVTYFSKEAIDAVSEMLKKLAPEQLAHKQLKHQSAKDLAHLHSAKRMLAILEIAKENLLNLSDVRRHLETQEIFWGKVLTPEMIDARISQITLGHLKKMWPTLMRHKDLYDPSWTVPSEILDYMAYAHLKLPKIQTYDDDMMYKGANLGDMRLPKVGSKEEWHKLVKQRHEERDAHIKKIAIHELENGNLDLLQTLIKRLSEDERKRFSALDTPLQLREMLSKLDRNEVPLIIRSG